MKQNSMVVPDAPEAPAVKPGWQTSEFAVVGVTIVTNLVAILVVVGLVPVNDQSELTRALSGVISSLAAIISNGVVVWKYVQSRTTIKASAANMQASLAMERYHASIRQAEEDGWGDDFASGGQ